MEWFLVICFCIIIGDTLALEKHFPTTDFLRYINTHQCNTHGYIKVENFPEENLCINKDNATDLFCSCNTSQCFTSRSCCIDIIWDEFVKSTNNNSILTIENYIRQFLDEHSKKADKQPNLTCQPVLKIPLSHHQGGVKEYQMVANCPGNESLQYKPKADDVPVVGSDDFIYKSAYYASCNGIDQYKPALIRLKTTINITKIKISNILQKFHSVEIEGMERFLCHQKLNCDDKMFMNFDKSFKVRYEDILYGFTGWYSLISFRGKALQLQTFGKPKKELYQCPELRQHFDILQSACINTTCEKNYKMKNSSCVKKISNKSLKVENQNPQTFLPWQHTIDSLNYYISLIGTPMSICGYVLAILSFFYFKELQNLPRLNTACMATALLVTDTFFLIAASTHNDVNKVFCKLLAIIIHWTSLCAMIWAFLTALDLSITFYANIIIPSRINKKRFCIYFSFATLFPSAFVFSAMILDENNVIDVGYVLNGVCWLSHFKARLFFYILPTGIGYFVTISALLYIIVSLKRKIADSRSVLKSSITRRHKTTKFIINLTLVLGVTEVLGFVQIYRPSGYYTHNEMLINAIFSIVYVILRSLRGVFITFIYIFNKSTLRILKMALRKRFPDLLSLNNNNVNHYRPDSPSTASSNVAYCESTSI